MQVANKELREQAKAKGVSLWRIAKALNISDSTFYARLRREFTPERKAEALRAIEQIATENAAE